MSHGGRGGRTPPQSPSNHTLAEENTTSTATTEPSNPPLLLLSASSLCWLGSEDESSEQRRRQSHTPLLTGRPALFSITHLQLSAVCFAAVDSSSMLWFSLSAWLVASLFSSPLTPHHSSSLLARPAVNATIIQSSVNDSACPYNRELTVAGSYTLLVSSFATINLTSAVTSNLSTITNNTVYNSLVTQAAINSAIECAATALGTSRAGNNVTIIVQLPSGTLDLSNVTTTTLINDTTGVFDVSNLNCPNNRTTNCGYSAGDPLTTNHLVVRGTGMYNTTIILPLNQTNSSYAVNGIYGNNTVNVEFSDLTFTRQYPTTTQGKVYNCSSQYVVVDVEVGFPTPASLVQNDDPNDQGRYIRIYNYTNTSTPLNPNYATPQYQNQTHITYCNILPLAANSSAGTPWGQTEVQMVGLQQLTINGSRSSNTSNRWLIPFENPVNPLPFSAGDLVAIKSKSTTNSYYITNGAGFAFTRVRWLRLVSVP